MNFDLGVFLTPQAWVAVLTLSLLEIVLGIDNLVFVAIVTEKLPSEQRPRARQIGLAGALLTRILLLFSLAWIARLTTPLVPPFEVFGHEVVVSGRALILFVGGLFLMWKAVSEIYHKVELNDEGVREPTAAKSFAATIGTIMLMDIIFSLDSVITAVGMVDDLPVMIAGVVIAMIVMIIFANAVADFINKYASLKILALAFLLMIGTLLTAEALEFTVPKAFVYFAMFFSLFVELVQIRYERNVEKHAVAEGGESV